MPTTTAKRPPRIAAIRRWVALCTVMAFLAVWLVVLTLGKGGVATSTTASTSTVQTGGQSQNVQSTTAEPAEDDDTAVAQDEAPSLDTSQS